MNSYTAQIIGELTNLLENVKPEEQIISELALAPRIFVKGCGRTGLVMDMFAMRLMQMGMCVHVIGETTSPKACPGDLLLLGSGSGETESLTALARKAKTAGVRIFLFTAHASGTLQDLCDEMVVINAPRKFDSKDAYSSCQPMGSLFEQGLLLYLESLVLKHMQTLSVTNEQMRGLHANLE